jgi:hypothetical protein
MAETLRQRLTRGYAFSIYIDGVRTFAATNATYHVEIKTYAAGNFTEAQIINALTMGWITQVEFDETMAIKYPDGYVPTPLIATDEPEQVI